MNFETTAGNLKSALSAMKGIVERRNTIPILGTVKMADGKFTATNLDMEVTVSVPATGKPKGEAAIDFFRLSALAKHIPSDEAVSINESDGLAKVKFNGSDYSLPSIPATNFPDFGSIPGERTIADNIGLVAALRRVRFAISTGETRYYLKGVALIEKDGVAYAAATDGHRLAMLPLAVMPSGAARSIIHHETVAYLCARKGEPKAITFQSEKPRALFEYDGLSLSAKLIDGVFPDIFRVIPTTTTPHLVCDRAALLTVLRRIGAFAHDRWQGVKIAADGQSVKLSSGGLEFSASETITAIDCKTFEAGYNMSYLIDALSALTGDTITIAAQEGAIAGAPCIISSEGDQLQTILMPMPV